MNRILGEKENEIANVVQSENDVLQKLKNKLEVVEDEKQVLQAKLNSQEKSQNIPQLIDSMLAEKNAEIDHLHELLAQREKQLEVYLSLDEAQLRDILRQHEHQKNSARTLSDILSIDSECEEASSSEAMRDGSNYTRQNVSNVHFKLPVPSSANMQQKRDVVDFSQPITDTPKVPRLELGSSSQASDVVNSNFIEVSKEVSLCFTISHDYFWIFIVICQMVSSLFLYFFIYIYIYVKQWH